MKMLFLLSYMDSGGGGGGGNEAGWRMRELEETSWRWKKMRNSLFCGKFLWIFPLFSALVHENKICVILVVHRYKNIYP